MRRKRILGIAAVSTLCVVAGAAALQQQPPSVPNNRIFASESATLFSPSVPTPQEVRDAIADYYTGTLPQGWTADFKGTVDVRYTGVFDLHTGQQQVAVVLTDDIADLDDAWLYLNGQQVFHATRTSGSVVNRGNKAIATMTMFVSTPPLDVTAAWSSVSGAFYSESITIN